MTALPDRRAVVAALLAPRKDTLVVTGLGAPTYDVAAAGHHDLDFYLWGAMGGAAVMGLGLALAQPSRPVLVITGDGEMLMGMGSFATIGAQQPKNLSIVVIDNALYGETGSQASHTGRGTDLAAVARACGIADASTIASLAEARDAAAALHRVGTGPRVLVVKVDPAEAPRVLPTRDGAGQRARFRNALGLPDM